MRITKNVESYNKFESNSTKRNDAKILWFEIKFHLGTHLSRNPQITPLSAHTQPRLKNEDRPHIFSDGRKKTAASGVRKMDGNGDGGGPSHPSRAPNSPLVDCYHPAHNNRADHVSAGMPLSEFHSHTVGIRKLPLYTYKNRMWIPMQGMIDILAKFGENGACVRLCVDDDLIYRCVRSGIFFCFRFVQWMN